MSVEEEIEELHTVSQSMQGFSQWGSPENTKCELSEEEPVT